MHLVRLRQDLGGFQVMPCIICRAGWRQESQIVIQNAARNDGSEAEPRGAVGGRVSGGPSVDSRQNSSRI